MRNTSDIYYNITGSEGSSYKIGDKIFSQNVTSKGCCDFLRKSSGITDFAIQIERDWLPGNKKLALFGFADRQEYIDYWLSFVSSLGTFKHELITDGKTDNLYIYVTESNNIKRLAHHTIFRYLFETNQYKIILLTKFITDNITSIKDPLLKLWLAENAWRKKPMGSYYGNLISNGVPSNLSMHRSIYNDNSKICYVTNLCTNSQSFPEQVNSLLSGLFTSIIEDVNSTLDDNKNKLQSVLRLYNTIINDVINEYSIVGKSINIRINTFKGLNTKSEYKIKGFKLSNNKFKLYSVMNDDFEDVDIPKRFCKILE